MTRFVSWRNAFSWRNFRAIAIKELIQMRRDRITFGLMVGIPLIQLIIFGFAINLDPKDLPTALIDADHSAYSRAIVQAVRNTGYFDITETPRSEEDAREMLVRGEVQFVIQIPAGFTRALLAGKHPAMLVMADATEPGAGGNALAALAQIGEHALVHDLKGPLSLLQPSTPPFETRVQRWYNPESITQYSIVPGLTGVILTMTMMIMTALSITRENELGTMEHMLALPIRPLEVMAGKIAPYILLGYVQVAIILFAAHFVFGVPVSGNLLLLAAVAIIFIIANLLLGFTFSTVAQNQLQAIQMSFFFFLPTILMSGFMFPFHGMPRWAQWIGECLPLTHFMRIIRGIMLKGAGVTDILQEVWPMLLFTVAVGVIALLRYRRTLD